MKNPLTKDDLNSLSYLCDLDLDGIFDGIDDISELDEAITEAIAEEEVIYYHNAMKILTEEDSSLQESLALASENGFTLENLNSEILATILLQHKMYEEIDELMSLVS